MQKKGEKKWEMGVSNEQTLVLKMKFKKEGEKEARKEMI